MPFLAVLCSILKAALPATEAGLRLSFVVYIALSIIMLLLALAFYMFVVIPAVVAVNEGHVAGTHLATELAFVSLVPTVAPSRAIRHQLSLQSSHLHINLQKQRLKSAMEPHKQCSIEPRADVEAGLDDDLQQSSMLHYALPNSFRGRSLIVRQVHTNLTPDLFRSGSIAGIYDQFIQRSMLSSWSTNDRRKPSVTEGGDSSSCQGIVAPAVQHLTMQAAGQDVRSNNQQCAAHGDPAARCRSGSQDFVIHSKLFRQASATGDASAVLQDIILQVSGTATQ